MGSRTKHRRRRYLRIAGLPALLAAVALTINCCHSDRYVLLFSGNSVASSDHVTASPASPRHCHSHRSTESTHKSGHQEGTSEGFGEPAKPASPDHEEACPGCNPTLIVQDGQKTRPGPADEKHSNVTPDFLRGLAEAARSAIIDPALPSSVALPANHRRSAQPAPPPLYIINQSFLI